MEPGYEQLQGAAARVLQRSAGAMTSSKLMAEALQKLPAGPTPILDICMILKRTEANVRRILADMEELGLVEKVEVSIPGRRVKYGWKKVVQGGDSHA